MIKIRVGDIELELLVYESIIFGAVAEDVCSPELLISSLLETASRENGQMGL
jgi:hypothetical protein